MDLAGRFALTGSMNPPNDISAEHADTEHMDKNSHLKEDEWRHAYDLRKEAWKQRAIENGTILQAFPMHSCAPDVEMSSGDDL